MNGESNYQNLKSIIHLIVSQELKLQKERERIRTFKG